MTYYFEDITKQQQLKKILDEWVGTPFRHQCGVKGLGCDCIHFVACVLDELGVFSFRKEMVPDYPKDWHLHNTRELLSEGIERVLKAERVGLDDLMNGDITQSHFGKAASHAGIYYEDHVYQAITSIGVCSIHFNDKVFRRQLRFAYRLLK